MSAPALLAATLVVAFATGLRVVPRLLEPPRRIGFRAGQADRSARGWQHPRLAITIRRRAGSCRPGRSRADGESAVDLAQDLEHVARLIRSGQALGAALADVAGERRSGSLLGSIAARRTTGASLLEAVAGAGREPSDASAAAEADRRLVIAVLSAVVDAGGPGSAALDRAADTIRERDAIRSERIAHAAQARLSAQILSFLPLAFTGWTTMTDDRVARFLLATPLGAACLATGIALDLAGWRWMHKLVAAS
jgi:Flp pilus assembly protein TadB